MDLTPGPEVYERAARAWAATSAAAMHADWSRRDEWPARLQDSANLRRIVDTVWSVAYRAGREDAARAVSDKLIEWADDEARRPRRTCCSHAIEEWIRQAAALARKEINLGRSSGSEEPGSSSGTEAGGGDG